MFFSQRLRQQLQLQQVGHCCDVLIEKYAEANHVATFSVFL